MTEEWLARLQRCRRSSLEREYEALSTAVDDADCFNWKDVVMREAIAAELDRRDVCRGGVANAV